MQGNGEEQTDRNVQMEEAVRVYIGLDLSLSRSGIVVLDPSGNVVEKTDSGYSLSSDASVKEQVERQIDIARKIIGVVQRYMKDGFVSVGIENYAFSTVRGRGGAVQSASQTKLAELHGVVQSQLLLTLGVVPEIVVVNTARKVALGKGNIGKGKILPLLTKRGFDFNNGDQADAYVIAEYMRKTDAKELFA